MHCSPAALAHTHKYNWRLEANSRYSVRPCPLGPETDGLNEPALAGAELKQNYAKHCRNKTNRTTLYMSPARHYQHCLVGILAAAASSKHGLRVRPAGSGFPDCRYPPHCRCGLPAGKGPAQPVEQNPLPVQYR